jgi:DNA-binding NarL/FixJ family response regulator
MKTRIMLVDDHRMFREGLASLMDGRKDMEVIGGACNGREALALAGTLAPDLVIMDVGMPEMNGIETVRLIRESHPGVRILALSAHREHRVIVDMLQAGASGYILKESPFDELVDAVYAVAGGRIFISPAASGPLVMELLRNSPERGDSAFSVLTSRELEILQAVAEGKSTKEIAASLALSVKTVETHRQQIMDKLDLHSVAELTKYAIREEITQA